MREFFQDQLAESVSVKKIKEELDKTNSKIQLTGLAGSALSIIASSLICSKENSHSFILNNKEDAIYLLNDIEKFITQKALFYPSTEKNPDSTNKKEERSNPQKAEIISCLNKSEKTIFITYAKALSEKVSSKKSIERNTLIINKGKGKSIDQLEERLIKMGFILVDFVIDPGQFSIRGGIIDIYSYINENPFRIEYNDNNIVSIRTFDVRNQLSIDTHDRAEILFNFNSSKINEKVSILDHFSKDHVVWIENISYTKKILQENYIDSEYYDNKINQKERVAYLKNSFLNSEDFCSKLEDFRLVEFSNTPYFRNSKKINYSCKPILDFNKKIDLLISDMASNRDLGFKNIILCSSNDQAYHLNKIFQNTTENVDHICFNDTIKEGFIDIENKLAIYTDHQIYNRYHKATIKQKFNNQQAVTIKELTDLKIGDFVTHIDYGIGKFAGLHKIKKNENKQEVIKILYKNDDILYTNIHSLHKIARFSSKEGVAPKISQLGSSLWVQKKNNAKKKVKEIAFNLIKIYAERKMKSGYSFSSDSYLQHELESSFIYKETDDQISATKSVKEDMENSSPMDRLICGDVGFGKTEIAIRASFKAVADNKQVAILVPTTILALQHFKTFKKRLDFLPCKVDYINRFRTKKEQKEIIKNLQNGTIDILIGTHKIISKDIIFKDLGLLIIDEEQKFGVNVKEKLKNMKSTLDTLVLSATPIPRTLQFSLMGARDLSIMNTPPSNRQPIETRLLSFNEKNLEQAISYELERNGQIFFVHNRIQNIKEIAELLNRICPKAKIKTAHGQMNGNNLEELMLAFIEGEFDILVSTTIIENGLDIPNANTIIINNAHNFGLSDLHQMRGRVGRSNKKAFCYLISPPIHTISDVSRKRLNALVQFTNLGSGFNIAMRDLDIRGAGDLLGADQSGFINQLGFETYQKILNEAVIELKEEKFQKLFKQNNNELTLKECQIETDLEMLIPNDYIDNTSERFKIYKIINSFKNENDIEVLTKELEDRFGEIPNSVFRLFNASRLKWRGVEIGFERIVLRDSKMYGYFISKDKFYESDRFESILNLLKSNPDKFELKEVKDKRFILIKNVINLTVALKTCEIIMAK